ncbi:MAG: DUF928 domain-containing protein [Elainellaceae cyanobacterium]
MVSRFQSVSTSFSVGFPTHFSTVLLAALIAVPAVMPALAQHADPDLIQPAQTRGVSLDELVTLMKRDHPPLGSRSDLCAISPGQVGTTDHIWSDRPLFLWQGNVNQIIVREFDTQENLWSKNVQTQATATYQIPYDGIPLQPGQLYTWQLIADDSVIAEYTFEVLPTQERDRITTDLQTLDVQLRTTHPSNEAIALNYAQYFAEQGLWSDALNALYRGESQSPELEQAINDIETYLCGDRSNGS